MERALPTVVMLAVVMTAGILPVQRLPALPSTAQSALGLSAAVLLALLGCRRRRPWLAWLGLLLAVSAWAMLRGDLAMQARLAPALAGDDVAVVGQVSGLPRHEAGATSFIFSVRSASFHGRPIRLSGRVHLAWYGGPKLLPPCSRWQLKARLKRPRGVVNPGGFDSERNALLQGTVAVGYVRSEGPNQRLPDRGLCVDRVRAWLSARIHALVADQHDAGMLAALAVADQRQMGTRAWQVLRATGTGHLFAISGMNIGLAAGLAALLAGLAWRLRPSLALRVPRPLAVIPPAWLAACAYAALAGFGVSVLRSLLMVSVVLLASARRRALGGAQTLALAYVALLAWQPLAVLSASFWLSFAGVAFLVLCLRLGRGWRAWLLELGAAQWLMTVGLLPLTIWFFGQSSLLAPLANLLAVPVIGALVTPLTLAGTLVLPLWPPLAALLLQVAAWLMHWTWWCMQALAALPWAQMYWAQPDLARFSLALAGAIWLLLPRGVPLRALGAVLLVPLLHPPPRLPRRGGFRVVVVDVGQGLSVVLRTRHHALVYDAGPRYPSGFDLGRAAVLPTLHALGVSRLDVLLISHGDNDHAGGGPAIAAAFPRAREIGSEPRRSHMPLAPCRAGQHWRWDGVDFRMVFPGPGWHEKGNNGSCVLLVSGVGGRLLLPGDIESLVEPAVARAVGPGPPLVLVVPHHGSDTSSSQGFVDALKPLMALDSAGFHNRFGHPRATVVARYRAAGAAFYNTAFGGALTLAFPPDGPPRLLRRQRLAEKRYWREAGQ